TALVVPRGRPDRLPGGGRKLAAVTIELGGRPLPEVLGIPLLPAGAGQLEPVTELAGGAQRGQPGQQVARGQVACRPEDGEPLDHPGAPAGLAWPPMVPVDRARVTPLAMTPMWLNACGKLPMNSPVDG